MWDFSSVDVLQFKAGMGFSESFYRTEELLSCSSLKISDGEPSQRDSTLILIDSKMPRLRMNL